MRKLRLRKNRNSGVMVAAAETVSFIVINMTGDYNVTLSVHNFSALPGLIRYLICPISLDSCNVFFLFNMFLFV